MRKLAREGNEEGYSPEDSVFAQDVVLGDDFEDSSTLAHIGSAQDEDLICIKDGVSISIKDNEFIAIFLPDLLAELAYPSLLSLPCQLVLLVHPGLEGCG
jgi:hypothetical protein